MSSRGSVTRWCRELRTGDDAAATDLWRHVSQRLVRIADRRLGPAPRPVRDEEDVALSAFKSLCRGLRHGRFPTLNSRDDLWRVLIVITSRKAQDQLAHDRRLKRRGGEHLSELDEVVGREPAPEFAVLMAETIDALIERLPDADLRAVALMKLEGYTNPEIAARLNRGLATVERKLRTIRTVWEDVE